jgi:hypothetical protein
MNVTNYSIPISESNVDTFLTWKREPAELSLRAEKREHWQTMVGNACLIFNFLMQTFFKILIFHHRKQDLFE